MRAQCCEQARDVLSPVELYNGQWHYSDGIDSEGLVIAYCPFCGTKLPESDGRS